MSEDIAIILLLTCNISDSGVFSTNILKQSAEHDERVSYEGAQVYRANLRVPEDIVIVRNLLERGVISSMWSLSPTRADFLVRTEDTSVVRSTLDSNRINHTLLVKNVQRRIDPDYVQSELWTEQSLRIGEILEIALQIFQVVDYPCDQGFCLEVDTQISWVVGNLQSHRMSWDKYPSVGIINEYLKYLSDNFPSTCNVTTIGHSSRKRPIKAIRISNGNPNNKAFLITAGLHAREWVAITSALYIANEIINNFDNQPHYVKDLDWYIVPLLNPDGYVYSQTIDRFWRKNRRKFGICYGVDINRNFDIDWNVHGMTELNVCSESYSGPKAFSESESITLHDFLKRLPKIPSALVDIHSYGQQILYPWCARTVETVNSDLHKSTAAGMVESIYRVDQKLYKHGPAYHLMYPAPGAALDWAYKMGVNHSYAIEARDKGTYGFLLPPAQILDTGKELFEGITYLASVLHPKYKKQPSSWL
nr:unnamed protein product [Amyelois transitella]